MRDGAKRRRTAFVHFEFRQKGNTKQKIAAPASRADKRSLPPQRSEPSSLLSREIGNRGNRRLLPTSSCTGSPRSVRASHERAGDLSGRLRMDRSRPPSAGFMMRAAGHWQPGVLTGMAEGAEPHRSCRPRFQDRESGAANPEPASASELPETGSRPTPWPRPSGKAPASPVFCAGPPSPGGRLPACDCGR